MAKGKWCPSPSGYPTFDADVARAQKKFPKTLDDLEEIKKHLAEHAGESEGKVHNRLAGQTLNLWKIRWGNTSKAVGKSGGFRLIYLLLANGDVYGVRFYDKGDRADIPAADLKVDAGKLAKIAPSPPAPPKPNPPKPKHPSKKRR